MTTTFFLVRHAAHDNVGGFLAGRTEGIRLGPEGRAQAQRLGRRMVQEQFDAICASPRERAQETAAAIAEASGEMDVVTDASLDEVDFGSWQNRSFEDLNADAGWQRWNAARSLAATPAGGTMLDVQHRIVTAMLRLAGEDRDGRIVLVSHADVIRMAVAYVLGLPIDAWPRFEISPASITTVVLGPWGGKVLTLNEVVA